MAHTKTTRRLSPKEMEDRKKKRKQEEKAAAKAEKAEKAAAKVEKAEKAEKAEATKVVAKKSSDKCPSSSSTSSKVTKAAPVDLAYKRRLMKRLVSLVVFDNVVNKPNPSDWLVAALEEMTKYETVDDAGMITMKLMMRAICSKEFHSNYGYMQNGPREQEAFGALLKHVNMSDLHEVREYLKVNRFVAYFGYRLAMEKFGMTDEGRYSVNEVAKVTGKLVTFYFHLIVMCEYRGDDDRDCVDYKATFSQFLLTVDHWMGVIADVHKIVGKFHCDHVNFATMKREDEKKVHVKSREYITTFPGRMLTSLACRMSLPVDHCLGVSPGVFKEILRLMERALSKSNPWDPKVDYDAFRTFIMRWEKDLQAVLPKNVSFDLKDSLIGESLRFDPESVAAAAPPPALDGAESRGQNAATIDDDGFDLDDLDSVYNVGEEVQVCEVEESSVSVCDDKKATAAESSQVQQRQLYVSDQETRAAVASISSTEDLSRDIQVSDNAVAAAAAVMNARDLKKNEQIASCLSEASSDEEEGEIKENKSSSGSDSSGDKNASLGGDSSSSSSKKDNKSEIDSSRSNKAGNASDTVVVDERTIEEDVFDVLLETPDNTEISVTEGKKVSEEEGGDCESDGENDNEGAANNVDSESDSENEKGGRNDSGSEIEELIISDDSDSDGASTSKKLPRKRKVSESEETSGWSSSEDDEDVLAEKQRPRKKVKTSSARSSSSSKSKKKRSRSDSSSSDSSSEDESSPLKKPTTAVDNETRKLHDVLKNLVNLVELQMTNMQESISACNSSIENCRDSIDTVGTSCNEFGARQLTQMSDFKTFKEEHNGQMDKVLRSSETARASLLKEISARTSMPPPPPVSPVKSPSSSSCSSFQTGDSNVKPLGPKNFSKLLNKVLMMVMKPQPTTSNKSSLEPIELPPVERETDQTPCNQKFYNMIRNIPFNPKMLTEVKNDLKHLTVSEFQYLMLYKPHFVPSALQNDEYYESAARNDPSIDPELEKVRDLCMDHHLSNRLCLLYNKLYSIVQRGDEEELSPAEMVIYRSTDLLTQLCSGTSKKLASVIQYKDRKTQADTLREGLGRKSLCVICKQKKVNIGYIEKKESKKDRDTIVLKLCRDCVDTCSKDVIKEHLPKHTKKSELLLVSYQGESLTVLNTTKMVSKTSKSEAVSGKDVFKKKKKDVVRKLCNTMTAKTPNHY